METLISILVAVIGGLGFLLYRKSKQNIQLKADADLTRQTERSRVVDKELISAQEKIDSLSHEMEKPAEESEGFWRKYGRK